MGSSRPRGADTPTRALAAAAEALDPPYRMRGDATPSGVELFDPNGDLPDARLSLARDRRLFSRTFALVVTAEVHGAGPERYGLLRFHQARLRRRGELRWEPPAETPTAWIERFTEAGLVKGATTMTNVSSLTVLRTPETLSWRLELRTLAGALIGTGPGSSVAIPLEPEDVEGLLAVLRALVLVVES